MAVIDNRFLEIGDTAIVQTDIILVGILSLDAVTDDTVGETSNRYFTKEFRFTVDGINYSNWLPLTTSNVSGIITNAEAPFVVDYKYTRSGTDHNGELEFLSVMISGTMIPVVCSDTFSSSIFSQFISCDNSDVLKWCLNVTQKMYKKGIVPEYVVRNADGNHALEDEDYLSFWRAVACYFAMIVVYGGKVVDLDSPSVIRDYLNHRGFNLSECVTPDSLEDYKRNYYKIIKLRGTKSSMVSLDGEFSKTICRSESDEFISMMTGFGEYGFVLDAMSPDYRHTMYNIGIIKLYEDTLYISDLSKYPLINANAISVVEDSTVELDVMLLDTSLLIATDVVGVGGIGQPANFNALAITSISPLVDYEMTFWVKVDDAHTEISAGFKLYRDNLSPIWFNDCVNNNIITKWEILEKVRLNKAKRWYFIRIFIAGIHSPLLDEDSGTTEFGVGHNARFPNCHPSFIEPVIVAHGGGGEVRLYDIKLRPMLTWQSASYMSSTKFVHIIAKNNSTMFLESLTKTQYNEGYNGRFNVNYPKLEEFAEESLLPYNIKALWGWLWFCDKTQ